MNEFIVYFSPLNKNINRLFQKMPGYYGKFLKKAYIQ
jgi:hypothetical protein